MAGRQAAVSVAAGANPFLLLDGDGEPSLRGGFSPSSGRYHFPLADACPYSGAEDVEEVVLPSSGRALYWTVVTSAAPGYAGPVPYGLGVVKLDGIDLQLLSRFAIESPDEIALDARLMLDTEMLPSAGGAADMLVWRFVPVRAAPPPA